MGGRGAYLEKGGFKWQEYKSVGTVEGIKIIERLDDSGKPNLPLYSKTPETSYFLFKDDGIQLREYGKDRMPDIDVDYGHSHKGSDILHIHVWDNLDRDSEVRNFTVEDMKKYGKILKTAGIKF